MINTKILIIVEIIFANHRCKKWKSVVMINKSETQILLVLHDNRGMNKISSKWVVSLRTVSLLLSFIQERIEGMADT